MESSTSSTIEVLITVPFPEELIKEVRGISPRLNVQVQAVASAEEIDPALWEKVEILYTDQVLPDPEMTPELRWVQFHRAGVNALIDHPMLRKEDLVATTLSGASASQVAEYVLMMLLALGHRLPTLLRQQAQSQWPAERSHLSPRELRESTVGVIGYGSVGRQVARLLHALGAVILATKRDAMHPEDSGYFAEEMGDPGGDLVHRLYPPEALRQMLKECDFVVVAVPLTDATRHLVGAAELKAMKPEAYLVDVSHGEVVDQEALLAALTDGKIAGAAVDVFAEEPLPEDSPLWDQPKAILSPHISGFSPYYQRRAIALFAENIYRYMAELPLYNPVDLGRGY